MNLQDIYIVFGLITNFFKLVEYAYKIFTKYPQFKKWWQKSNAGSMIVEMLIRLAEYTNKLVAFMLPIFIVSSFLLGILSIFMPNYFRFPGADTMKGILLFLGGTFEITDGVSLLSKEPFDETQAQRLSRRGKSNILIGAILVLYATLLLLNFI